MSYLSIEGAELYYEEMGEGPTLIFIPGANGTANIYSQVAELLQKKYKVITFDRRGFGRSQLTKPLSEEAVDIESTYRIKNDANDVAALIKMTGSEPAYIFGSSSGAIVAMETLQDYPEVVKKIAFHEPPLHSFLDNSTEWAKINNEIVETSETQGMAAAMQKFGNALHVSPIDEKMMAKPAVTLTDADNLVLKGMAYWFKYEIRQYTGRKLDLHKLMDQRDKIILFNGIDSVGSFPQIVVKDLSKKLGLPIDHIAGGHLGYAQKPQAFATTLQEIMK